MSEIDVTQLSAANGQIVPIADADNNVFQSLALRAMFWRPSYLENSAWLEHIPFAFWLIEAHQPRLFVELGSHYGASYFAFCQAVERLELDTRCFAIDTWAGDEHAHLCDSGIFNKVNAYNESKYSSFSRLVCSNFDNAVRHFADGTIDLLHIDGLHTLEAMRHDFETWLPKLSDRAVVLVHGINVRERNSGVFKLFTQLQMQYPAFEFVHGEGLGVIGVGASQSDLPRHLLKPNKSEFTKRAIHDVFFRLGRACADSFSVVQQKKQIQGLDEAINKQKTQLEELKQAFGRTQTDLSDRAKELNDTKSRMDSQIEHHAIERGQLSERITFLQEIKSDLKKKIERLQTRMDATSSDFFRRTEELARLEQVVNTHIQQSIKSNEERQLREEAIAALRQESEKKQTDIESLQAVLAEREGELANTYSMQQSQIEENLRLSEEYARLVQEGVDRQHQLNSARRELQERDSLIAELRSDKEALSHSVAAKIDELARLTQIQQSAEQILNQLQARLTINDDTHTSLRIENKKLGENVNERFKELAHLTHLLAEREQELPQMKQCMDERCRELAQLTRLLEKHEQILVQKDQQLTALLREVGQLKQSIAWRVSQSIHSAGKRLRKPDKHNEQKKLIVQSGLFDVDWYLQQYPDVAKNGTDPIEHFLLFGAVEKRNPNSIFNTLVYCEANSDALKIGENPLVHYIVSKQSMRKYESK